MTKVIALTCPECAARFVATHHRQQFCTTAHKAAFNNRQKGRSSALQYAQAWRAARSSKDPAVRAAAKRAFAKFCREIDAFNSADRERGGVDPVRLLIRRDAANLIDF